jgi:GNAT superfamily N-acetyltransferase
MNIEARDVEIHCGLPESHRRRAAEILYDAFSMKYGPLTGGREHGLAIVQRALEPDLIIVALRQAEIVGLAGLQHEGRRFLNWKWSYFADEFGRLRGFLRAMMMRFDYEPQHKGQLLLDALAVDVSMRGKGIGLLLLQAVFEFARANGYRSVRLGVVDTNPDARRLYERLGFVPTHTHHYPYLRRLMGFSAATTMVKRLT